MDKFDINGNEYNPETLALGYGHEPSLSEGAVFASGMAAISTAVMAHVNPGDVLISSKPIYGGTHYFFYNILPRFGVKTYQVSICDDMQTALEDCISKNKIDKKTVKMVYLETKANPFTGWMLLRSLETLGIRMRRQAQALLFPLMLKVVKKWPSNYWIVLKSRGLQSLWEERKLWLSIP